MDDMSEVENTPKRVPRKRVSDRRGSSSSDRVSSRTRATRAPRKRATRKTAVRREAPPSEVKKPVERVQPKVESSEQAARKAPTAIASSKAARKRKKKQNLVVAVMILAGIGASAAVGYTDKGQIDIQKTMEERNERIRNNTLNETDNGTQNVIVPVQNTSKKPDGGLRGSGIVEPPKAPEPEVASTTATSTDEMASSTDEVASSTDEVVEETNVTDSENETEAVESEEESVEASEPAT